MDAAPQNTAEIQQRKGHKREKLISQNTPLPPAICQGQRKKVHINFIYPWKLVKTG